MFRRKILGPKAINEYNLFFGHSGAKSKYCYHFYHCYCLFARLAVKTNSNEILTNKISIFWQKVVKDNLHLVILIIPTWSMPNGIFISKNESFNALRIKFWDNYLYEYGFSCGRYWTYMEPGKKINDYFDNSPAEISIHILIEEA